MTDRQTKNLCALLVLLLVGIAALLRYRSMGNVELFTDHMNFTSWSTGVRYGLTGQLSGQSSLGDLIYELLVPIYNAPYYIYNVSSLAAFLAVPVFGTDQFAAANIRSIIIAALAAVAWGYAAYRIVGQTESPRKAAFAGLIVVAGLSVSDYWFHYSVQGWHNYSVMALGLMVALFSGRTGSLVRWAALINAVFSYFIMPWLAWVALAGRDLTNPELQQELRSYKRRVMEAALIIAPGLLVTIVLTKNSAEKSAQIEFSAADALGRALGWLDHFAAFVGWPMMVATLVGAVALARRRESFALIFLALHFVMSVASNQFGEKAWFRTTFYLIPVSTFTVALCLYQLRSNWRWVYAVGLAAFFGRSVYNIVDNSAFNETYPGYLSIYESEPAVLKDLMLRYSTREACILPEDFFIFQAFKVWCPTCPKALRPRIALVANSEAATLTEYLERHSLPDRCKTQDPVWIAPTNRDQDFFPFTEVWMPQIFGGAKSVTWSLGLSESFPTGSGAKAVIYATRVVIDRKD